MEHGRKIVFVAESAIAILASHWNEWYTEKRQFLRKIFDHLPQGVIW